MTELTAQEQRAEPWVEAVYRAAIAAVEHGAEVGKVIGAAELGAEGAAQGG